MAESCLKLSLALGGSGLSLHHAGSRMRESKQGGCCLISCVNSVQGTYVRPVVLNGYGGNDFASRVMSSIGQCLKTVPLPKLEGVATGIQRVEGRNDAENSTVHRTAP